MKYYRLNMYFFYQELNNQKFSELLDKKEEIQKQEINESKELEAMLDESIEN